MVNLKFSKEVVKIGNSKFKNPQSCCGRIIGRKIHDKFEKKKLWAAVCRSSVVKFLLP